MRVLSIPGISGRRPSAPRRRARMRTSAARPLCPSRAAPQYRACAREGQWSAAGLPFHRRAGDLQVNNGPVLPRLAPQREGDRPAAQHLTPALTGEGVLQFYVAQLRLTLGNQVADDEWRSRPSTTNSGKPSVLGGASRCSDSATAAGTSASPRPWLRSRPAGGSAQRARRRVPRPALGRPLPRSGRPRSARGAEQEGQERQRR